MTKKFSELSITRDGQVYEEELIFERSRPGRVAFSLPTDDRDLPLGCDPAYLRDEDDLKLPEVSEPDVIRHYSRLSTWNYGIDLSFYPLGSCTMKYNPRINEEIAALPRYTNSHPALPERYSQVEMKIVYELQTLLSQLTDLGGTSIQPAAGAHGELAGLFIIHAYTLSKGEDRKTILVPDSAHGTNPASCTLAGFNVKQLKSAPSGLLDIEDLKSKLDKDVAGLMITNPSTLGIFEKNIEEISRLLHENGSLLYMDGANFNAIIGKTSLGKMGVDITHLNLHKTFSTPHGGGGPGAAAICVNSDLTSFLPDPVVEKKENGDYFFKRPENTIGKMKSGPGHFGVALRALAYILTYGSDIHKIAEYSILNANLVRTLLQDHYEMASREDTMHEAVFNDNNHKKNGFTTLDVAKGLLDYGYHPPTVFFPLTVSGAMMIEPTETESPETIRHFTKVMKELKNRIDNNDEDLKESPKRTFVRRVDETLAARQPVLNFFTKNK